MNVQDFDRFKKMEEITDVLPIKRKIDPNDIEDPIIHKEFSNNSANGEIMITIPLPKELLNNFSVPKDCVKLVLSHMLYSITILASQEKCANLVRMIISYNNELFERCLNMKMSDLSVDYINEWKKLAKKYKNDKKVIENLSSLSFFIAFVQRSRPFNNSSQ